MKAFPWLALWAIATAGLLYWIYTEAGAEPGFENREQLNLAVGGVVVAGLAVLLLRAAIKAK